MSDEKILDAMIDRGKKHARVVLLENKDAQVHAIWDLVNEAGDSFAILTPEYGGDYNKEIRAFVRGKIREHKAVAYMFCHEAWVARASSDEMTIDEGGGLRPNIMPADNPNRREVVIIFASTRSEQRMAELEIKRDASGAILDLIEGKTLNEDGNGRFLGSIPSLFD
jgi:hypothetical protein